MAMTAAFQAVYLGNATRAGRSEIRIPVGAFSPFFIFFLNQTYLNQTALTKSMPTVNKSSILCHRYPKKNILRHKKQETILVITAHGDYPAFGAGGTLAKYAKEGKRIRTIILSYGELSQPHIKPEIVTKTKQREAQKADTILGGKGIEYLGLKDATMLIDIRKEETEQKLAQMIDKENPSKIFTHGTNIFTTYNYTAGRLIKKLIKEDKIKCPVYTFHKWGVLKITKRNLPKLIVDITNTFNTKIEAIKAHKSEASTYTGFGWLIHMKARLNGWKNGFRYAEAFDRMN